MMAAPQLAAQLAAKPKDLYLPLFRWFQST
jgi:hypothetical protein